MAAIVRCRTAGRQLAAFVRCAVSLQSAAGRERDLQSTDWSVICRECGNDLQIIGLFSYLIDELMGLRLRLREEVVGG